MSLTLQRTDSSTTSPRKAAPSSMVKTHRVSKVPSPFGRASMMPAVAAVEIDRDRAGRLRGLREALGIALAERGEVGDDLVDFFLRRHADLAALLVDDEGRVAL